MRHTSRFKVRGNTSTARLIKQGKQLTFSLPPIVIKKPRYAFCLKKATCHHDLPEKVAIDKSGPHTAALKALQQEIDRPIKQRQCKHFSNSIKSFRTANLAGTP
jgi:hypothetical protein